MENEKFYIGNYKEDAGKGGGWFVGHFIKDGVRKNRKVEIKYWKFDKGKVFHKEKTQKESIECTLILKGKIDGEVAGEKINLETGQYIVVSPGVESNFPINVYEKVEGITIKAPSTKGDTQR